MSGDERCARDAHTGARFASFSKPSLTSSLLTLSLLASALELLRDMPNLGTGIGPNFFFALSPFSLLLLAEFGTGGTGGKSSVWISGGGAFEEAIEELRDLRLNRLADRLGCGASGCDMCCVKLRRGA